MRSFALLMFVLLVPAHAGEKLSASNVDVRTTIAFKVSDAAVQQLVPAGWELSPPPEGPAKGYNLAVVLIDSFSSSNAEGKPVVPFRGGVLAIPVKKQGTNAIVPMIVYGITLPEWTPGSYGVYVPGKPSIARSVRLGADGKSHAEEAWSFKSDDGHSIEAQIQYERGTTTKAKLEAKVYSAMKPEFFRIYRVDQVSEVARSAALGVNRISKIDFKATGSRLAPFFDGSEQIVAVTSIPSYSRTIFLPD